MNDLIRINGDDELEIQEPIRPSDVLEIEDAKLLGLYISNPSASPDILRVLARHDNEYVACQVADNENTPADALSYLLDRFAPSEIGWRAARNHSTPPDLLARLLFNSFADNARDSDWGATRRNVLANSSTPLSAIIEVLLSRLSDRNRASLAMNPSFKDLLTYAESHDQAMHFEKDEDSPAE